jgi:3-deoxy-D-manno-octulosonate 8-phosphate phosphatase (KDO 8-P phosphatase)
MHEDPVTRAACQVRLVLLDVDGVLTDGRLFFFPDPGGGLIESKFFDVSDGAGIALGRRAGLEFGLVSGRQSPVVTARAVELGISEVHLGVEDKGARLGTIVENTGFPPEAIAFVGDEVVDLPVMRRVGFPVAVGTAPPEVQTHALYVTRRPGGRGAVREVVELILRAQDKWDPLVAGFLV